MGFRGEEEQNCAARHTPFPFDKTKDRLSYQNGLPEDSVKVHWPFICSKERAVKACLVLPLLLLVLIAGELTSTLHIPSFHGGLPYDLVDDILHAAPLIGVYLPIHYSVQLQLSRNSLQMRTMISQFGCEPSCKIISTKTTSPTPRKLSVKWTFRDYVKAACVVSSGVYTWSG